VTEWKDVEALLDDLRKLRKARWKRLRAFLIDLFFKRVFWILTRFGEIGISAFSDGIRVPMRQLAAQRVVAFLLRLVRLESALSAIGIVFQVVRGMF
jgi:hypothetical protein